MLASLQAQIGTYLSTLYHIARQFLYGAYYQRSTELQYEGITQDSKKGGVAAFIFFHFFGKFVAVITKL